MRTDEEQPQTTSRPGGPAAIDPVPDHAEGENTVVLVGRVSAAPEQRDLPSGDALVTFRLVVPRAMAGRGAAGTTRTAKERTTVDVIDVACWSARTRRSALRLEAGGRVRVEGSLRRRFFRTGGSTASRYEVEASSVRVRRSTDSPPGRRRGSAGR